MGRGGIVILKESPAQPTKSDETLSNGLGLTRSSLRMSRQRD